MIDVTKFRQGMELLGAAFNREITKEVMDVYGIVAERLDDEAWERAVRRTLETVEYFPPPAALLRLGMDYKPTAVSGSMVYEQILAAFERGEQLDSRSVRASWGEAARDAFIAAGGTRAFEFCEVKDQPFRRRAFLLAWDELVARDIEKGLKSGTYPALPEAE
jgi:hypothetical protein